MCDHAANENCQWLVKLLPGKSFFHRRLLQLTENLEISVNFANFIKIPTIYPQDIKLWNKWELTNTIL